VLVAIGKHERLSRILLCSGGKRFIDDAVRLTGTLAAALHANVTLFNVMAEPPAIYAHLIEMEEDVDALLASRSELGRNLAAEKKVLEKLGVSVNVRVRHGFIVDQLLNEIREGDYDLIVSGSSRARGPLQHYIMGDVTEAILENAECSVLVARSQPMKAATGFWQSLAELFR
jgi:nucleotide-binding universal stress UspA family protein